jgi:hypothetical protein
MAEITLPLMLLARASTQQSAVAATVTWAGPDRV